VELIGLGGCSVRSALNRCFGSRGETLIAATDMAFRCRRRSWVVGIDYRS
jgi:hypothetical protein